MIQIAESNISPSRSTAIGLTNQTKSKLVLQSFKNSFFGDDQKSQHKLLSLDINTQISKIGALGNPSVKTPHLDHLAKTSTIFTNAYTSGLINFIYGKFGFQLMLERMT